LAEEKRVSSDLVDVPVVRSLFSHCSRGVSLFVSGGLKRFGPPLLLYSGRKKQPVTNFLSGDKECPHGLCKLLVGAGGFPPPHPPPA
jgi:hypothetical protein